MAHRILLSDPGAARTLGEHAAGSLVEILLTVDLGDRREGVLAEVADACAVEPHLSLGGACVVQHVHGYRPRFPTEIRSGGGPIYGYDFVSGAGIAGLERTDRVLTAVVLECYRKPPAPQGTGGLDAFGHVPKVDLPDDDANYALLHLGRRDCGAGGLRPLLPGSYLAGATSDVSVLITPEPLRPGDTVSFAVDYDALVRAVTSPFVAKEFISGAKSEVSKGDS